MMKCMSIARTCAKTSVIVFLAIAVANRAEWIDATTMRIVQSICLIACGASFATISTIMRTRFWRAGLVIACCQCIMGIAGLVWTWSTTS